MNAVTTLLDFLRNLLNDPAERAAFNVNPEAYLREHGFEDLSGHDVHDAMGLVCDTLPPRVALQVGDYYRTGGNRVEVNQSGQAPPPVHTQAHERDLDAAIRQINYVTTNYAYTQIDDRDTIIDNSVRTDIHAKGAVYFDQDIHNQNTVASGDSAVAAGHDLNAPVQTGHDNLFADHSSVADHGGIAAGGGVHDSQLLTGGNSGVAANHSYLDGTVIGDHNQVAQGSNAIGFGHGDVSQANISGGVDSSNGGAVSVGGDAHGSYADSHVDVQNFGHGDQQAVVNTGDHAGIDSNQVVDHHTSFDDHSHDDHSFNLDDHHVDAHVDADHSFNDDHSHVSQETTDVHQHTEIEQHAGHDAHMDDPAHLGHI
jgi:hypothetical protein